MTRAKKTSHISVINWMGTLLLCAIPGVNVIALILFLIFAKSSSKKSFALAVLLWGLLSVIAVVALLLAFPAESAELAQYLREAAAATPAPVLP